jgi:quercetin dioxygenase-like cupin family protein
VFAHVLSGSIRSRLDAGETRVYRAGETFFEDLGVRHSTGRVVADTGAKLKTDDP